MLSFLLHAARGRHLLGAAAASLLIALTPPAAGAVGTYAVQACSDGPVVLPVSDAFGGWLTTVSDTDGSHKVENDCGGVLGLFMQLDGTDRKAAGDYAGWKFSAPTRTKITDVTVSYDSFTRPSNGHTQGAFQITTPGAATPLLAERGLGARPVSLVTFGGLSVRAVQAAVYCESKDGLDCPTGEDAAASIHRSVFTLVDDLPPSIPDMFGSAVEDSTWQGVEKVLATGTDFGSGVAEFRWYVDGEVVLRNTPDANGGACVPDSVNGDVPMYHAPKPCPGSATVSADLDTMDIADGPHQMDLVVADASGRESPMLSAVRIVTNHPPVNDAAPAFSDGARAAAPHVGEDLVATRGTWSGPDLTYATAWERCEVDGSGCVQIAGATVEIYAPTAADVGKRLQMAVTATNPGDSVTARTALTPAVTAASVGGSGTGSNGGGTTAGGGTSGGTSGDPGLPTAPPAADPGHVLVGHVAGEPPTATCPQDRATLVLQGVAGRTKKLRYGRAGSAAVVLTCTATGKAIANARLDVATRTGSRPAVATQLTTGGDGRAALRLARGASRAITVGYRMYADDPLARATVTLRVEVRGRVRLRASRRTLRNGQAVRLSGTLAGGRVPRRGVDLAVQWRDGRRWRPFAQVRTDRRGRFHYAYRFTRTRGSVRYALRVQVLKGQVDYPYAPAASNAVRVVVRG